MSAPNQPNERDPQRSPDMSSPAMQAFEAQLASLRPREDRLDRERLMFLAGQASVVSVEATTPLAASRDGRTRPKQKLYPLGLSASLGALTGAAAAALIMLAVRPAIDAHATAAAPNSATNTASAPVAAQLPQLDRRDFAASYISRRLPDRTFRVGMDLNRLDDQFAGASPAAPGDNRATSSESSPPRSVYSPRSWDDALRPSS